MNLSGWSSLCLSCAALLVAACSSSSPADSGSTGPSAGGAMGVTSTSSSEFTTVGTDGTTTTGTPTSDGSTSTSVGGASTNGVTSMGGATTTTSTTTGAGGSVGGNGGIEDPSPRTRESLNTSWRFTQGDPQGSPDLTYPQTRQWVLPTGNRFVSDPGNQAPVPDGNLGDGVSYTTVGFDDGSWQEVTLPHDYAIDGPYTNSVSPSMGRLPSPGVSWYRKRFTLPAEASGQSVALDLDGAMQYSLVWVNGSFVGGWPYGYAAYRIDLSEVVLPGEENVIAVRLETPVPQDANWDSGSSRWYPGAGIYRDVWLNTMSPVHVGQWGTYITTPTISAEQASVDLEVTVDNDSDVDETVTITTEIYELDSAGVAGTTPVASLAAVDLLVPAGSSAAALSQGAVPTPKLWGVPPSGTPNMYMAYTTLAQADVIIDGYTTSFGIRSIEFDGEGFWLNGEDLKIDGVCLHHDLGAIGAAANTRARQRQLEILQEMGTNGVRTAHNPFEPKFYDLADRMGFVVMDEAFDVWGTGKTAHDHHEFFEDWYEQDLRALIRRNRNHPSVIMWSIGNEIPEQTDANTGPARAEELTQICHEEDPTRPTVSGMNRAEPDNPFSVPIDTVGLNYQGTGVRDLGAQYPTYHDAFPNKFVVGTETTSTFSTRGTYLFPVTSSIGEPASGSTGIDTQAGIISSYDLYHADWSYSPDEEFTSQDSWPYVGGEFVWTGFDYLGEPTPLDAVARSSYFGIIDLAGFKKDRFYLYQAYWRPDHPMAHILPHWTWPGREGQITPVHVYTSGDSAELFINDVSQGMQNKGQYEYRLRWDSVVYEAGTVRVVAYKGGEEWATSTVETAGAASKLELSADRTTISGNGVDLSYVTLRILDDADRFVPTATHTVTFQVSGPGEIVATDNGDPTDRQVFSSPSRDAYSGMALAIIRSSPNQSGSIEVTASSGGLAAGSVTIQAN